MGARKRFDGFQKPLSDPKAARKVSFARISYNSDGSVTCSCRGWGFYHKREKVLEDAIDRHIERKHNGRGFRL